jgi:hypothetical protein
MMFEANNGQTDSRVKFLSHAPGYTLFLTDQEAVLSLPNGSPVSSPAPTGEHSKNSASPHLEESVAPKPTGIVRLKFAGGSTPAAINGRDQLPGKTNYFIGNDPKQWHTNVPNYDGVVYRGVYPGVDAVFHGDNRRLEFDFIVAPDANPHAIALEVEGGENNLRIGPAGEVIVGLGQDQHGETDAIPESHASITLLKPVVYQEKAGKRHDIEGKFTLLAENKIGFALGTYDHALPLVIDPAVEYSTYLGPVTTVGLGVAGIGVDAAGNAYIAGTVEATNYPTTSAALEPSLPDARSAFVTKLNPTGTAAIYSTYLGGTKDQNGEQSQDNAVAIAVHFSGDAYIAGTTTAVDFPTTANAFDPTPPYGGIYLTELTPDGSTLLYSTYFEATTASLLPEGLAVDWNGDMYLTGDTVASDLPLQPNPGAFQSTCTGSPVCQETGFISKFDPSQSGASSLVYSTYMGSVTNSPIGIAVDTGGNAYVTGITGGGTFPVTKSFDTRGLFVTKMNPLGTAVVYSDIISQYVFTNDDPIAVDSTGAAYVTGESNRPILGGKSLTASGDIFVFKLDPTGATVVYSDQFGGSVIGSDVPLGIALDPSGDVFIAGETSSTDFPITTGAPQTTFGGAFATEVSPDGSALTFSTYWGGSGSAGANGIAADSSGAIYLAGTTGSSNFPVTSGAYLSACVPTNGVAGSCNDGFVSKIFIVAPQPPFASFSTTQLNFGPVNENTPDTQTVTVTNTGSGPLLLDLVYLGIPLPPGFSYIQVVCGEVTEPLPLPVPLQVNSGAACTFTVQFDPATTGSFSGGLAFVDNAGPGESSLTSTVINAGAFGGSYGQVVSLSGTGVPPPSLVSIAVGPMNQSISAGTQQQFTATGTYTSGPTQDITTSVAWSSSNSSEAAINSTGLATGVAAGTPTIQATLGSIVGSTVLTVTAQAGGTPSLVSIAVGPMNQSISVGTQQQFTATGTYTSGPTQPITTSVAWSSLNSSAATINASTGLATAVAAGNTTIQATLGSIIGSTTLTVTAQAGGGAPTCGSCSTTGPYVAPNPGSIPAPSSGAYSASVSSDGTVTVTSGSATLFTLYSLGAGTTAGLSPDGATLAVNVPNSGVTVYNLMSSPLGQSIGPTPLIGNPTGLPSRIQFSPSGQYLAYTMAATPVAGQNGLATLIIYNVRTAKIVYENSNYSFLYPGSESGIQDPTCSCQLLVDNYGNIGSWGFSPDNPETTFVYAFLTDANDVQWNLVHLEQPPTSNTNGMATQSPSPLTNITSAFWQFSPCGDVIAIVTQPSANFEEIQFVRTVDGALVSDQSGILLGNITLASNSTQQVATDVTSSGTQTYTVDDSTNNLGCSAENTPPGSNVTVQPVASWTGSGNAPTGSLAAPVTLTFPSVNSPGGQITLSEGNTGTAPPNGFALGNPPVYYDLEEIPSTLSVTAPITICINFTGTSLTGQPALFHIVNGVSTALTEISVDTTNHIVCAQTPSLSPFAVFGASAPVSTTTALTSSLSSSVDGQAITLTAQITPSLVGTPTGTVTFSDGAAILGTGPLNGSGSASISTSLLPTGTDSITAVYSGDTYFAGSTSSALALTVNPAPLTVTANSVSRQYGASDPAFTVSYSGFVNGDGPGALSGTLTCTAGDTASSPVGTYTINCSGLSSPNYSITFLPGPLSITPAPLTITANNASKVYGAANPAFSATDAGFVNGDTAAVLSGALSCASAAAVSSPVGSYPINCSGVSSTNYSTTFVPGALTVTPAALTIAANNATRLYGGANPAFTASSSGFVNGDNASVLIGVLSCSTTATPASPVGTYPVTCSGQSAANYSINYVPGQLSVTPAPLTITANNVSRPYGEPNPSSFGVAYSGFVNGDTSSSLSGALSCTTTAVATSPVGTYPITCTGLTSSNYAITFVPGTLTVIKEVLSITAKFISIAQESDGNYVVTIAVTNNGDITANKVASGITIGNLVVPGGSLGDKADISSIPALNVAPGATANITLLFPASAGKPLTTRELFAYGFATANNPSGIPVLPALWVLQPAPTQVTLP